MQIPSKAYGTGMKGCMLHQGYRAECCITVPCSKVSILKKQTQKGRRKGHINAAKLFHYSDRGYPSIKQRCGSGSESGYTYFWASWIRILLSLSQNSKKNLDFYCFVTSFDFLPLNNDVKVPSKSNVQKNFFLN
jgi:hypothetical protein